MRYQPEHKEVTHRRIIETASKQFRAHGYDGVGIAKLMGVLKLTHGGFYAHFADKEELVAEASVVALNQSFEMILGALETGGFPAMFDYYLSAEHRDHPDLGCPLPALAAEVARRPLSSRAAFTKTLLAGYNAIAEYMPGQAHAHNIEKVGVLFASMVGAIALARAVSDPALSDSILRSTKDYLLRFIEDANEKNI